MLGAPIGTVAFVGKILSEKIDSISDLVANIPLMEDAYLEFSLLRSCLFIPKLSYILRTVDTSPFKHI